MINDYIFATDNYIIIVVFTATTDLLSTVAIMTMMNVLLLLMMAKMVVMVTTVNWLWLHRKSLRTLQDALVSAEYRMYRVARYR